MAREQSRRAAGTHLRRWLERRRGKAEGVLALVVLLGLTQVLSERFLSELVELRRRLAPDGVFTDAPAEAGAAGGGTPHEQRPDLLLPQRQSPNLRGWEGWRPRFGDYLFVAFSVNASFGTGDTPVLSWRCKQQVMVQALLSLAILVMLAVAPPLRLTGALPSVVFLPPPQRPPLWSRPALVILLDLTRFRSGVSIGLGRRRL